MGAVLDLHCHTVLGSPDSELTPHQLAETAAVQGLTACCVTEHDKMWERHVAESWSSQLDVPFLRGMEVTTNMGHVLVYGLDRYMSGIHDARTLRRTVLAWGGLMILAHPFRKLFHQVRYGQNGPKPVIPTVEEAAEAEIFSLVDEIEVLNGGTAELENYFALRVARHLGFHGVAGSDAHSTHGLGRYVTVFRRDITSVQALVEEVKEGRFFPAAVQDLAEPTLVPYSPGSQDPEMEARVEAARAAYA
ncbi:MAG: PHP domain-containing protein [Chloroflexi bacterium]|nr:PHP domain-containing protein [Chloroflexota bacterium]